MLKKALDHSKIESNLIGWVKLLEENNVRERVLCQEEFESLFVHCTIIKRASFDCMLSTDETRLKFGSHLGGDRSQNGFY